MKLALILENSSEYGRRMAEGIADYARSLRTIRLAWYNPETLSPGETFAGVDGIIARITSDAMARRLARTGLPVANVFFQKDYPDFFGVMPDQEAIGKLAAEHFLEKWHKNFAFVGFRDVAFSTMRRDGFLAELGRSGRTAAVNELALTGDMRAFFNADLSPVAELRELQDWLAGLPRPVAVFAANDLLALNLLHLAAGAGIGVPDDMAILGVDDDKLICAFADVPLSSIDQNARGVGYAAARMLVAAIKAAPDRKRHRAWRVAPAGLVERASSGRHAIQPEWLADVLGFIDANLDRPLSTADLVKFAGRSHVTISKAFAAKLGVSPVRYITERKMNSAQRMLAGGDLLVKEVALRVGYTSFARFSAIYKGFFARSPRADIRAARRETTAEPRLTPAGS